MFPKTKSAALLAGIVLAAVELLVNSGCGSGSASGQVSNCSLDTFTPNYARNVDNLLEWSSFPLTVFFVRDANYSQNRQSIARAGFDQWVTATNGALSYQVVTTSSNADITVKFDPSTANGLTELHFTGLQMQSADMTIGVQNLGPEDIQCVGAHEFGHALGLNGHSDSSNDLMYPVHVVGDTCPVTTRDLNTMKTGYCDVFTRSVRTRAGATGPIRTVRIQ